MSSRILQAGQRPHAVSGSFPFQALFGLVGGVLAVAVARDAGADVTDYVDLDGALEQLVDVINALLRGATEHGPELLLAPDLLPVLVLTLNQQMHAKLQTLGLTQISRLAKQGDLAQRLLTERSDICSHVWHLVASRDISIAMHASRVLRELVAVLNPASAVFTGPLCDQAIASLLENPDTLARFRFFDLLTELSASNASAFDYAIEAGWLGLLAAQLRLDGDPLEAVNVIELLGRLANTRPGGAWLGQAGVVPRLCETLFHGAVGEVPPGFLAEPLARFVLPNLTPSLLARFPIEGHLANWVEGDDATLCELGLTAIGLFGFSACGWQALSNNAGLCRQLAEHLESSSAALRSSAFLALALLFDVPDAAERAAGLEKLFRTYLTSDVVSCCLRLLGRPFPDERLAVYAFMRALARYGWGTRALFDHPALFDFLCNVRTESDKPCFEAKYQLCTVLAGSPELEPSLGHTRAMQIKRLAEEGVLRGFGTATVAIESQADG